MATRGRKRTTKAIGVVRKASKIYKGMKKSYQTDLQDFIGGGASVTRAAKKASTKYKKKYGATKRQRWENALSQAAGRKRSTRGRRSMRYDMDFFE